MAKQNIFDNAIFFEGYKKLRDNAVNANTLFEIPALLSMLPALAGKQVLDLGCGFGEHCKLFLEQGAEKVVGIDISEKMLEPLPTEALLKKHPEHRDLLHKPDFLLVKSTRA